MKRTIFSMQELAQTLLSVNQAQAGADFAIRAGALSADAEAIMIAYREGFKAALGAVALAVGIPIRSEE
jgi:hypothetical protein